MVWHNNAALYIIKVYEPLRACLVPVACPCDSGPEVSFARRLPLRMRAAPRVSGGKAAAGGSGECRKVRGGRGKIEEKRKKTEKGEKKSLKSLEIRQRALPLQSRSGRGAWVPPPRIGGSSLNRKKEARAGPAVPAPSGRGFLSPAGARKQDVSRIIQ